MSVPGTISRRWEGLGSGEKSSIKNFYSSVTLITKTMKMHLWMLYLHQRVHMPQCETNGDYNFVRLMFTAI